MSPPVPAGLVVNLTAFSTIAAALAVNVPYVVLVTLLMAAVAAVPVAKVTVAALSTFSANGSG